MGLATILNSWSCGINQESFRKRGIEGDKRFINSLECLCMCVRLRISKKKSLQKRSRFCRFFIPHSIELLVTMCVGGVGQGVVPNLP